MNHPNIILSLREKKENVGDRRKERNGEYGMGEEGEEEEEEEREEIQRSGGGKDLAKEYK